MNKHPLSAMPHDFDCPCSDAYWNGVTECACDRAELMAQWDASEERIVELEADLAARQGAV